MQGLRITNEPVEAIKPRPGNLRTHSRRQIQQIMASIAEFGFTRRSCECLTDRYVARLLDLAFLPPALVEDVLAGRQPVDMTAEKLSRADRGLLWVGYSGQA